MKVEKDYEGLLRLFNKHKVKYCIVGAFAVAFYAKPRYTKDIDILVEPSAGNSKKIINALNEFGFKSLGLKPADFIEKGKIIQLGYEPVRIDLITSIQGCSFEEVWKGKKKGIYGKERVYFIGIKALIKNKMTCHRPQDKLDLKLLLKAKSQKK